jgi:hypothetical protein
MLLFLATAGVAGQSGSERFTDVAERLVEAVNDADYKAIDRMFSETMRDFMPLEKNERFFEGISAKYGRIVELDEPWVRPPMQATFVAECEHGKLDIDIWLNDEDEIIGLRGMAHKPGLHVPERNYASLKLPFEGQWLVSWGGDTKELNRHHDVRNQRFAFDFLAVGEEGRTRKGRGNVNDDYFAFGREILAPADGTVTDVITGVRDNIPGSMNPYSALGNAVFIRHRRREISILAHFKFDSIKVKVGDNVKAGQVLGLCGNSGNSSEPHLHYHLQNTPIIQDGTGIKCFFENVLVEGEEEKQTQYSPKKGDIIESATGEEELSEDPNTSF